MHKGRLIRNIRKKQGVTQVQLAKVLGVTQMALSAWELDTHNIAPKHAFAFIKWAAKQGVRVQLEQLLSAE